MMNGMQMAIIKKDLQNITSNKRMFSALLIVPIVMSVFLPTIFVLTIAFSPVDSQDFKQLADLLGPNIPTGNLQELVIDLLFNSILPLFFLIIPIMASSIMAATAFVGEKEKSTLETLLYCPLPLKKIFNAKIMASFILGIGVSLLSFIIMTIVVEIELRFTMGSFVIPGISWLAMMLLVAPAISLIAIALIVRGSAKAQTSEESQQRSVFLLLPIMLLVVSQFTGIMMINALMFLGIGVVLAIVALLMLKSSYGNFQYETLLH